jgi:hypothetical protein
MTPEEAKLTIEYLKEMQEEYIEGEGYERHPLPEWYALDKAIETIEQTIWIPVNERLPEEDGLYLVYTEEQPFVCSFEDGEFFIEEVLAWMPLPEPYKAESEVTT